MIGSYGAVVVAAGHVSPDAGSVGEFAIARVQVLAHVRDQQRDKLLLDVELAEAISQEAETQAATKGRNIAKDRSII